MTPALLTARRLIAADEVIDYPRIAIDADGLIAAIEPGAPNTETTTLAPAFFDIHIHGAAGGDVMEASPAAFAMIVAVTVPLLSTMPERAYWPAKSRPFSARAAPTATRQTQSRRQRPGIRMAKDRGKDAVFGRDSLPGWECGAREGSAG